MRCFNSAWMLFGIVIISCNTKLVQQQEPINRADTNFIHLADPAVFYHKKIYYMYGTVERRSGNGFLVYTSKNLRNWQLSDRTDSGYALKRGEAYGNKNFWAPHVFAYKSKFYMAYVADENIAIAESENPYGPFTQSSKIPIAAPVKQIDPFIFIDTDGKIYLYHVRLSNGNRLYVAEMNEDLLSIKEETLRECINAEPGWENTANAKWPVAEGPSVFKDNGTYYFVYSANDFRNPDYAVGYATSDNPYGPWTKFEGNPIMNRGQLGVNGPGHGDFFTDRGGQWYYVFHTHFSKDKTGPRKTAIIKAELDTMAGVKTIRFLKESMFYPVAD